MDLTVQAKLVDAQLEPTSTGAKKTDALAVVDDDFY